MQEFFKTTLVSKFIKYLLMVNPLPTVSYLSDYDIMVKGNFYLHHGNIYKCEETGVFNSSNIHYKDYLYCSESVYCSKSLKCTDGLIEYGGKRLAKYILVDRFIEGQDIPGVTTLFHSNNSCYDMETHIKLGEYLRFLRSMYGLDLMSLYNCYCNYYVDNVNISTGSLNPYNNPFYKTTLIPVKFNKTYTIAINSSSTVFVKPVIYNKHLLKTEKGDAYVYDNKYTQITKITAANSNRPLKITTPNVDEYSQKLEKHLYLAIQLPVKNNSSITVLEGAFDNYINDVDYDFSMFTESVEKDINRVLISRPSLLTVEKTSMFKPSISKPFSDRLVEYLIGHTIDMRDEISENIARVSNTFGYRFGYEGSWSNNLCGKLFDAYMNLRKTRELNYDDILGFIDKDLEDALNKGYIRNGINT